MKNIKTFVLGIAATALAASSCNVLDLDPTDRVSPSTVWQSEASVDQYVIGFYSTFRDNTEIHNSTQKNFTDAYSDIMKSSSWALYNHGFNKSLLEASAFTEAGAGAHECWETDYERIRRQNEMLRDAPGYIGKFGEEFINIRMAEVRFCRAFTYMHLIRVYGGVVLRTAVDGPEQNDKPRSSEEASWALVLEDLEFAANILPTDWKDSGRSRATKTAAYGLMSRAALFAKKWDLAVTAAEKAKEFGGALIMGEKSYARVFENANINSSEMLFAVAYDAVNLPHKHDSYFRPKGDQATHNNAAVYAAFGPTSELVDSYEMADGTEFSWEVQGQNPYAGREPRFYASILYNGADWESRKIETFVDGKDGIKPFEMSQAAGSTVTGYYFRKFLVENDKGWETTGSNHFAPVCRYAEVLLNKAEALAEADFTKNRIEALAALNEVRQRVNLPNRTTTDKDTFMKYLRKERMVELAGEGFRYWDLRRWRLAVEVINGKNAHGVKITKQADGTLAYEHIAVDAGQKRIFYDKYYAFSIPTAERANNNLLGDNNPGW